VPPVLHDEILDWEDKDPPPVTFDAKVDIFFLTLAPPQRGQTTLPTASTFLNISSKDSPHSPQANSYIGIFIPFIDNLFIV
jgi:hypothetical protein